MRIENIEPNPDWFERDFNWPDYQKFTEFPVSQLLGRSGYNRRIRPERVAEIVKNFNPQEFDPVKMAITPMGPWAMVLLMVSIASWQ